MPIAYFPVPWHSIYCRILGGWQSTPRVLQSHHHHGLLQVAMCFHDAPEYATSHFMPIAYFPAPWHSIYCCILGGIAEHPKGTPDPSHITIIVCYGLLYLKPEFETNVEPGRKLYCELTY
jgi:hypothetical protein